MKTAIIKQNRARIFSLLISQTKSRGFYVETIGEMKNKNYQVMSDNDKMMKDKKMNDDKMNKDN